MEESGTTHPLLDRQHGASVGRRTVFKAAAAVAGAAALAPIATFAQEDRDYGPDAPPVHYPDSDIVSVTPAFDQYRQGNSAIQRLWTGGLWLEGPAWNGVGRFLLWSDIPNNVQLRWLEDNGFVSVFRIPSGNSNGNTVDWEGRQISCQHGNRQVVRYEHDGSTTVLASQFEGKPFNSPNGAVVHPNGSIFFTDPPHGTPHVGGYEGNPGEIYQPNVVYRIDPDGKIARVTDELEAPNGLCFSHDYQKLYIVDTGAGARDIKVFDIVDEARLANGRVFTDIMVDGEQVGPDAVRADIDGNIWASGGWFGYGFDGVHVFTPEGQRIGHIRLPETTSNLVFGGPKRNRLMIGASQSIYAVYVNMRGAHIT
ncbi:MAG: SMP-30/gluconolactonase/LRE family protein [Chloroflexi bacterium]|nr:SMP-30/gluconolactonase/LRE family protein [Chloroflexota bacterium]